MSSRTGTSAFVVVDVEATGATPMTGVMTEFGAVDLVTGRSFYGRLWPSTLNPDNPAQQIVADNAAPDVYARFMTDGGAMLGTDLLENRAALFICFTDWLSTLGDRAVFVSDNPAYDFQWVSCGFDEQGLPNPFGYSGRRIGDLAAGFSGRWRDTTSWKKRRVTRHDHSPVNDAMGNVEALRSLLDEHAAGWREDFRAA
jgi:hypothetical protein